MAYPERKDGQELFPRYDCEWAENSRFARIAWWVALIAALAGVAVGMIAWACGADDPTGGGR